MTIQPVEELLLYGLIAAIVFGAWWWVRRGAEFSGRMSLLVAGALTLAALFTPLPEREGQVYIKVSFDPLRGLKQALLLPTEATDVWFAQAWAIGNLVLLWPLAVVLLVNLRWSWQRVFAVLTVFICVVEVAQGSIDGLRRSFEVADIITNLGGLGVLFFALSRYWAMPSRE